jgi:pimeloyl-ACP methyl ester carboxylesterase
MAQEKSRINDLLIVLPGITGSVLERNGVACWGPAPSGILNYLTSFGNTIDALRLAHDDPDYDDGIRATRLVPYTVVPGLASFDGYTGIKTHLFAKLQLSAGEAHTNGPAANYFEFPYDWRRDNRLIAKRLQCLIDRELPKWREHTDNPDAKVIFLAHSMGGLIARYYVEVFKGFANTKALITFGTPHRGSLNAIEYLAKGYRKAGVTLGQFTSVMRSLPSVYQLLPRYPAVRDAQGKWCSVSETEITNIDREKARDAAEFYKEIDEAYTKNKGADEYDVELLPIFGWGHQTRQSALVLPNLSVELRNDLLPPSVEDVFQNGDGTVPRVSAIPIELNAKPLRWWPVNQKHATIQNNRILIENLAQTLTALQGRLDVPARALPQVESERRIELEIDQVFSSDEPVAMTVKLYSRNDPGDVSVEIQSVSDIGDRTLRLKESGGAWTGEVTGLPPGTYRASVQLGNQTAGPPDAVNDIFEVLRQHS